jgi:hypothetical protein
MERRVVGKDTFILWTQRGDVSRKKITFSGRTTTLALGAKKRFLACKLKQMFYTYVLILNARLRKGYAPLENTQATHHRCRRKDLWPQGI